MSTAAGQREARQRRLALIALARHRVHQWKHELTCPCHYAVICGNGRCAFDREAVAVRDVGPRRETVHVFSGCGRAS